MRCFLTLFKQLIQCVGGLRHINFKAKGVAIGGLFRE